MKDAYSYPEYCDIAYDWGREPECDFIEKCIERYSDVKQRSILDIACGTGIHLREFARRGYETSGLDARREMVDFVIKKALEEDLNVRCLRLDMRIFDLKRKFGCAICMLDSFRYLLSEEEVVSHLKSVASCIEVGGLYIIDLWMPEADFFGMWEDISWFEERENVKVNARYIQHGETLNPTDRTFDDELIFKVTSPAFNSTITSRSKTRAFLFNEFRDIVHRNGLFDLKGRFYNFDFKSKGGYNIETIRTSIVLKKRR